MVSDISDSDGSAKGTLHGVNLLDVSNGNTTPGGTKAVPSEDINRFHFILFLTNKYYYHYYFMLFF